MNDCIEDLLFVPEEEMENGMVWPSICFSDDAGALLAEAIREMNDAIIQAVGVPAQAFEASGHASSRLREAFRPWRLLQER